MKMMYLALAALVTLAACADTNGGYNTAGLEGGSGWNDTDISSEDLNDPASRGYFKNSVGDTVLFDVDEFTLNSASKAALDIQAEWLVSNPGYVIVLEGHADERGTREYNLALGFRRAQSVQEYLVARGVSGLRLKTRSYGKERPVEICSSERCYEKNRRTVTLLTQSLS
jgi:peptidoglycan-associated lipoprotein